MAALPTTIEVNLCETEGLRAFVDLLEETYELLRVVNKQLERQQAEGPQAVVGEIDS